MANTEYFVDTCVADGFANLTVATFAFRTQLCHIAHCHHAVARHLGQNLRGSGHGTDVGVVAVIKKSFTFAQHNREQAPFH